MENVSHNTSFDSAEEDDNLSRDPDQRVFEQDTPEMIAA